MIRGNEFHSIIKASFGEVRGYLQSEQVQVNCPRCQENDYSDIPDGKFNLEISTSKRMFRCWKCDDPKFSGSLRKLLRLYGSKTDFELYKSLAGSDIDYYFDSDEEKIIEPVYLPTEIIYFSQMNVANVEHIEAYNYMVMERKISREILFKFKIGFCTSGKYAKRIIIPSYDDQGDLNYFVARSYLKDKKIKPYDNPKSDKNEIIFNEGLINWDSVVYLSEGVFEMLTFPVNTIPMLGKTISPLLYLKLKELKPKVVVLLDPDAFKNSIELYYQLYSIYVGVEDRVKIIKLPNNDDLDELRRKFGVDAVIENLYSARTLEVDDYFYSKLKNPYVYNSDSRGRFNK